jgi:hypothetical protein
MKRKFILYPAVALALMTSASLSSCVDTDEPESLENLRNAVAQEVQANAGLLNAKAAVENAYVAVVNADARKAEALAAREEYKNVEEKAKNEKLAAEHQYAIDTLAATSAQYIEAAKQLAEKELTDAKAKLEKAKSDYEKAIKDANVAIEKAHIELKRDLAKLAAEGSFAEGADGELYTKLDAIAKAEKKVAKAEKALADYIADDCFKASDRQTLKAELDAKEVLLNKAKADLEFLNSTFESKKYDAFAELWQKYEAEVLAGQGKNDSITIAKAQIARELEPLSTAEANAEKAWKGSDDNSAVSKFKKKVNDALNDDAAWNPAHTVTVKISNIVVAGQLAASYGAFKKEGNDADGYQYKATGFAQKNNIKDVLKDLKSKLESISKDKLGQNAEIVDYLYATISDEYKTVRNQYVGSDGKSGDLKAWKDAVTNYNKADTRKDAAKLASALETLKEKAQTLFGKYADGVDWQKFTSSDIEGHIEEYLALNGAIKVTRKNDKGVDEVVTVTDYKQVTKDEWKTIYPNMGSYGAWKVKYDAMDAAKQTVMSDAATDLANLNSVMEAFAAKTDLLNNSILAWNIENADNFQADLQKNGYNDAANAAGDVKKAREAYKAAQAAAQAVKDKQTAANNSAKAFEDAYKESQARAEEYYKKAKALNATKLNDQERADLYEVYKAEAIVDKENAIASAQIEFDDKKKELDAFDAGEIDKFHKDQIKVKSEAVDTAKEELETAKAEYDRYKSYYGIN